MANTNETTASTMSNLPQPSGAANTNTPQPAQVAVVVITIEIIELVAIPRALGWFRWRYLGVATLRDQGHAAIEVTWLDRCGAIRCTLIAACRGPAGDVLGILDGDRPDAEMAVGLLAELYADLESCQWHWDCHRPNDLLDELFAHARRKPAAAATGTARAREVTL